MAELASRSIVSSLLGLLENEALLLSRVGGDVEFIKAEMEAMHSFLEHLARTEPPTGGHNEQVRTWMKQVRDLAHDCSCCIDLYLRRGDQAPYRARGGRWRWRYLWWASWLVQKLVAQHNAAVRLRELKERAYDVGKRRLRYGVEIPRNEMSSQAAAAEDDDHQNQAAAGSDHRQMAPEHCSLEEYCAQKLANWFKMRETKMEVSMASIAIVAPDDTENSGTVALESLTCWASTHFTRTLWINLPEVHFSPGLPLPPSDILIYILRECEESRGTVVDDEEREPDGRRQAYHYKKELHRRMSVFIKGIRVKDKIEEIKKMIGEMGSNEVEKIKSLSILTDKSLDILLHALLRQMEPRINLPLWRGEAIQKTASILKSHIERGRSQSPINLEFTQYIDILHKMFPANKPPQALAQEATACATTLGEDNIKEIIKNHKIALGIIWEMIAKQQLPEGNSDNKERATSSIQVQGGRDLVVSSAAAATAAGAIKETKEKMKEVSGEVKVSSAIDTAIINETVEKMDEIAEKIQNHLLTKGIVDRIKIHLKNKKTLIILQYDEDYASQWEETINALNLLGCAAGSAVIVFTKNSQKAKEFCYPPGEPITCSLVGLYHDIALQLTQHQQLNIGNGGYNQILRDILDRCHPHEFCMKIFTNALYSNPKRSYEELCRLCGELVPQNTLGSNTNKMLKFSYDDLTREYKTCLLHLAIFPKGHKIRRSTLIGRWVTEGLITNEDWRTAVRRAEHCFEALIKRGLVLPCDIGIAGKIKSCMVGEQVHGFITKIANKEQILDARMSDLWARHFSIFSGLRLRTSDGIDNFVHNLHKYSPQLLFLKLLDLHGSNCFHKNRYLKDICNKILLLKYLSLRGTNVTHLPSEINNLSELEVLDIRQTMVPEHATRHVLLVKLRRFMADRVDPISRVMDEKTSRFPVEIPRKIEKMENLEVLSSVKASRSGNDLKGIRHLWQLRKLDVVIQDKNEHLYNLLRAVSDLKDCLQSLSVTISDTTSNSTPSSKDERLKDLYSRSIQSPKHLKSLTINGVTESVQLLELLGRGSKELAKVTLSGTLFKQENLFVLAVLPKLCCLWLRYGAYNDEKLTFKKEEFPHLKYFLVDGTNMTGRKESMVETAIEFGHGAAVELEKIVLSFTSIRSIVGMDNLPKLKELELEGNEFLHSFLQDEAGHEQNTADPDIIHQSRTAEQNTERRSPEESRFTFKKEKFKHLKYFRVEHSQRTNIIFETGAAPELKKISLSLGDLRSELTGVSELPRLKEVELKGKKFLLSFFDNAQQITKVTLRDTQLKQELGDLQILSKKRNLHCLELSDKSFDGSHLAFNKGEFPKLDILIVECASISSICFSPESAPKLKKIVWTFTEMESLSGINNLPKLKEVECIGELVADQVRKDIAEHIEQPVLTHKKPHEQDQEKEISTAEDDDTGCPTIPRFLKIKNWC